MTAKTKIVLVDDHNLVREGLRGLLEAEATLTVVGEAADGLDATKLIDQLKPDVAIIDLMLPGLNGLEVTRQIAQRSPQTRVIILSMHASEAYVLEALRKGASAYVLKNASGAELRQAIADVVAGKRYLSPPLSERAIAAYIEHDAAREPDIYESLTNREREVFQLVAEGHTNVEIGARLHISPRTVEVHRAKVMRKLDLSDQADLIRYARLRGTIASES